MHRVSFALILSLIFQFGFGQQFRSIDASENHIQGLGSTGAILSQSTTSHFSDGISDPAGQNRMNEREISNILFTQDFLINDPYSLSDFVWVFGQFVDHDISLVANSTTEFLSIEVPEDDPVFVPSSSIFLFRSQGVELSGTSVNNPRSYANEVTSYLDLSCVYGSDDERADWLRVKDGSGKLKTSQGNLLPWNTPSGEFGDTDISVLIPHMEDEGDNLRLFVAGDVRANENPLLLAMHTLFVREHNRLCDLYIKEHSEWLGDDELLYQTARKHLIAYYQSIVFNEWLPAMGVNLPAYTGYKPDMDPSIMNVFSAAAFRLGHTLINSEIVRMSGDGTDIPAGNISLRDAFFKPKEINVAGGIDPYIKGMATQVQQNMDTKVIDDVRNFLFDDGNGGLDLAAINIKRGRERGLADYNTIRADFGMPPVNSFITLTGDQESADLLEAIYGDVNDIDPWVGMLAEKHMNNAILGELIMKIMERQFQNLREGDRFYFENGNYFSDAEIEDIKNTNLHDLIMRNTEIDLMQDNVFEAMPHSAIPNGPDLIQVQLEAVAYPNPTSEKFHIKIHADQEELVTMKLFSTLGEYISSKQFVLDPGDNFTSFSIPVDMPRGLYTLHLETLSAHNILRIVKEY